jgi:hypothetical protein
MFYSPSFKLFFFSFILMVKCLHLFFPSIRNEEDNNKKSSSAGSCLAWITKDNYIDEWCWAAAAAAEKESANLWEWQLINEKRPWRQPLPTDYLSYYSTVHIGSFCAHVGSQVTSFSVTPLLLCITADEQVQRDSSLSIRAYIFIN